MIFIPISAARCGKRQKCAGMKQVECMAMPFALPKRSLEKSRNPAKNLEILDPIQ